MAKFLNVGVWFPYMNHHSAAIKISNHSKSNNNMIIDFTLKVLMRDNTNQEPLNLLRLLLLYHRILFSHLEKL